MYVVIATFGAQEGKEDQVADWLAVMIPHALAEPGCHMYVVNRSVDDPRRFVLYEQYADEEAFQAHLENPAFKDYVLGKIVPLLETRSREICTLIDPASAPA